MIQRAGRSSQEQLVRIQTLMAGLLDQDQVESLVGCVLTFLQSELDYPLLWIAKYDANQSELIGLSGGLPQADSTAFSQRYPVLPGDLFDQALLTRNPIEVMNLQEEGRVGKWQKLAQRFDIQGAILYPIQYRKECVGLLLLGSAHWGRNPRTEESTLLSLVTHSLGAAFNRLSQQETVEPVSMPSQPLAHLINQMNVLTDWDERVNVVLRAAQQAIDPTFTGLYWLDFEENSCVLKVSYQPGQGSRLNRARPIRAQVQMAEIEPFCQALSLGQMVSVSESQGSMNAKVPLRLMQQTKSRAFLCAPIMGNGQLLGFLSVEGKEPRVWQDQEKNFIKAAAQLMGLSAVAPAGDNPVHISSQTQTLMGQFTQLMVESKDWPKTLKKLSEHLCRHLQTQRLLLLSQDEHTGGFRLEYQYHSPKLRPLLESLHPLSDVDRRMLERNIGAIALSDLEEDLRFLAWRESLISQGLRSLLVCRTVANSSTPQTILILGNHRTRTWKPKEIEFLQEFAQTLGTFEQKQRDHILQQAQLKQYDLAHKGLQTLLKIEDPTQLITSGIELITHIFDGPLAAGVLWIPGHNQGKIVSYHATSPEFAISDSEPIQLDQDPLFTQLLHSLDQRPNPSESTLEISAKNIAPETRIWLNGPGVAQVFVIPLQSPDSPTPLGAIILGTSETFRYKTTELKLIHTLVQQLGSRYRYLRETNLLQRQWMSLESLTWYKNRFLETNLSQLADLQSPEALSQAESIETQRDSHHEAITSLTTLLKTEDWQLSLAQDSIPLASILRRCMEQIEPLVQSRQLWTQIHNLTSNTTLTGTSNKLELVLYELLVAACQRSKPGDRIDIWCRLINAKWVELSITDHGELSPKFIQDFQTAKTRDLLLPSLLDKGPGRHLNACQSIIELLGGRMEIAQLEDERILSRLTLPQQMKGNRPN